MAYRKFTTEELNYIKQEYLNGKSINEIAKDVNSVFSTISLKLKEMGIFQYKNKRWTTKEITILKENYSSMDWDDLLLQLPQWSKEDIIGKASDLGIKREVYFWNENDIRILTESYNNNVPIKEIYTMLNEKFSIKSIFTKAHKLGLKQRELWTDDEKQILVNNYRKLNIDDICKLLPHRSRNSIIAQANKLGLEYKSIWTDKELKFLIDNHKIMSDSEIAHILGRTKDSVRGKRFSEKLYKPIHQGVYNYLSEYIRKRNRDWKEKSMKKCNYKCVITGKRFDAIHHLYGMNIILQETLDELNYDENISIKDLTDSDLDKILNHFFIVQNRYPLGICLSYEIHKQFHDNYGYGDNTPEQFEDFLKKYNYKIA